MGDDYSFHTEWRVAGSTAEVARVLGDARRLPLWWPSVNLAARIPPPPGPSDAALCDPPATRVETWRS